VKGFLLLGIVLAALGVVMFSTSDTVAYNSYNANEDNCFSCHPSFKGRGALHDMHVGSSQMTNTCTLCHVSIGDNPSTSSSGTDPNHGCNGCHMGPGLRAHHINAGAPADGDGFTCTSACHSSDPTPPGEDTLPAYYSRGDVNVNDPCDATTGGPGEDYSGDGEGLDNDGDLVYDAADTDCGGVQVEMMTWGQAKAIYR
jgi:hypothetical protein